jgi:Secretion system C-terminal sorting domain
VGSGLSLFPSALSNPDFGKLDFFDVSHGWATGGAQFVGYWDGTVWTTQNTPAGGYSLFDVDAVDTSHVWTVGGSGGYVFFWNGSTWTQQFTTAPAGHTLRGVAMIDTANGWACGDNGLVLHYQGGSWTSVPGFNSSSVFFGLEFTDANHGWMVERYYQSPVGYNAVIHFYNGIAWMATDTFPSLGSTDGVFHFRDSLHGTLGMGLPLYYLQYDNGVWSEKYIDGAPTSIYSVYFLDSLNAWASGFGGTLMRTRTGGIPTGINLPQILIRTTGNLYCRPNPVHSTATIEYHVTQRATVHLAIYNNAGKQVTTLVYSSQPAGTYTLPLDGRAFASGMYYVVFTTGGKQETLKLVIE